MGTRALLAFRDDSRDDRGLITDDHELGVLMLWEALGHLADVRDMVAAWMKANSRHRG